MNYDEKDLIEYMLTSYQEHNNIQYMYDECLKIVYNVVIYNDFLENILDIINEYGGVSIITDIYNKKYKNSTILEIDIYNRLQFYELLAFIGIFDTVITKVLNNIYGKVIDNNDIDNICSSFTNVQL